jgi:hypothetical protein
MPVKSKAQQRFMGGVASGDIKKPGLSKAKAEEFLESSKGKIKDLPEKVTKKGRY